MDIPWLPNNTGDDSSDLPAGYTPHKFVDPDDYDPGVSEDELEALNLERSVHGQSLSDTELANQILTRAAPQAAQEIVRLATSRNSNERVRFQASTYIIERTCGKVGDAGTSEKEPWTDIFAAVTREAEEITKSA
jgi:hypothetical protein